jgi:hypothetical protein
VQVIGCLDMQGFESHIRRCLGVWESKDGVVRVSVSTPEEVAELCALHPEMTSVEFVATIAWTYTNTRRGSSKSVFGLDSNFPGVLFTTGVDVQVPERLRRYTEPMRLLWNGDEDTIAWASEDGVLLDSAEFHGDSHRTRRLKFDLFDKAIDEVRTVDERPMA